MEKSSMAAQPFYGHNYPSSSPIRADIRFGVLQADGSCLFTGICRIHPSSAAPRRPTVTCREARASIWLEEPDRLIFFFLLEDMSACTRLQIFDRYLFDVPHAVLLPPFLSSIFGAVELAMIPAGVYPIHPMEGGYRIVFKCTS
jgi:hypothetical protein